MNEAQPKHETTNERVAHAPCPCREVLESIRKLVGISPAVRQHLTNSRVEFLKAIRQVLDDRIAHLSAQDQQGTKVTVE
jgi:hypothetical protein